VDGIIPEGHLEKRETLLSRSRAALETWSARLEQEGLGPMIERPLLRVPLPPETMEQGRRHWGDFSETVRWARQPRNSGSVGIPRTRLPLGA
jgi:hypothetical protein